MIMTTHNDVQENSLGSMEGVSPVGNTKPVTVLIPEDILKRLKIVAIMKDATVGELLAEAAISVVKRDLRKILGKLEAP